MMSLDRMRSWKMSFIIVWKVAGELVRPKYITSGSKSPQLVWKNIVETPLDIEFHEELGVMNHPDSAS
jgi:hypothetical protein